LFAPPFLHFFSVYASQNTINFLIRSVLPLQQEKALLSQTGQALIPRATAFKQMHNFLISGQKSKRFFHEDVHYHNQKKKGGCYMSGFSCFGGGFGFFGLRRLLIFLLVIATIFVFAGGGII
jgi:hypothetical protein